jgi:glucose-1-phosphate thymidylyltransferase
MEAVGLIPAAGIGSRLGKLPFSKEITPLYSETGLTVVSENLIRYFRKGGIEQLYFIIRKGKWDIPEFYGDGSMHGVHIGYLLMNLPFGTPFTISQALPFIGDKPVALGFPDILFEPEDAFAHLKKKFDEAAADLVLGIVPSVHYLRSDMIEFDMHGRMADLVIKQNRPDLKYSWFIAFWTPSFSRFLMKELEMILSKDPEGRIAENGKMREIYMGDIFRAAIRSGMKTDYLLFPEGSYTDMGTREELKKLAD